MTITLTFLTLVILLLTGMPIFAAITLTSMGVLWFVEVKLGGMADAVFASLNNPLLAAIPMFAFMAHVMIKAKVVDDLFATANRMVGHLPGGLRAAFAFALSRSARRGRPLKAGDYVATGNATGIHDIAAGQHARVEFAGHARLDCHAVAAGKDGGA